MWTETWYKSFNICRLCKDQLYSLIAAKSHMQKLNDFNCIHMSKFRLNIKSSSLTSLSYRSASWVDRPQQASVHMSFEHTFLPCNPLVCMESQRLNRHCPWHLTKPPLPILNVHSQTRIRKHSAWGTVPSCCRFESRTGGKCRECKCVHGAEMEVLKDD